MQLVSLPILELPHRKSSFQHGFLAVDDVLFFFLRGLHEHEGLSPVATSSLSLSTTVLPFTMPLYVFMACSPLSSPAHAQHYRQMPAVGHLIPPV